MFVAREPLRLELWEKGGLGTILTTVFLLIQQMLSVSVDIQAGKGGGMAGIVFFRKVLIGVSPVAGPQLY